MIASTGVPPRGITFHFQCSFAMQWKGRDSHWYSHPCTRNPHQPFPMSRCHYFDWDACGRTKGSNRLLCWTLLSHLTDSSFSQCTMNHVRQGTIGNRGDCNYCWLPRFGQTGIIVTRLRFKTNLDWISHFISSYK